MNWSTGYGIDATIGLSVGDKELITLWASRADHVAYLIVGSSVAEIRLERVHLESMRDQLPGVLAAMDRAEADDAACEAAEIAGERAVEAAALIVDGGDEPTSQEARDAAAKALAAADAVDSAVRAVTEAAAAADQAAEKAQYVAALAARAKRDDRGCEPAAG